MAEENLREIKIEQEPTQVTWRRCTQCNAAQMEFQLREEGICQECYISNLEKENAELKKENSILRNDVRVAREDRERLQLKVGKGLQEFIHDCPYSALKFYASEKLVEENEQLNRDKTELVNSVTELTNKVTELEGQKENIELAINESEEIIAELKEQIEKMKCENSYVVSDEHLNSVPCYTFYECKHCCKRSW